VVRLFVRDKQQIIQVELEDEEGNLTSVGATVEHPFWVGDRGWVGARELLPGMRCSPVIRKKEVWTASTVGSPCVGWCFQGGISRTGGSLDMLVDKSKWKGCA